MLGSVIFVLALSAISTDAAPVKDYFQEFAQKFSQPREFPGFAGFPSGFPGSGFLGFQGGAFQNPFGSGFPRNFPSNFQGGFSGFPGTGFQNGFPGLNFPGFPGGFMGNGFQGKFSTMSDFANSGVPGSGFASGQFPGAEYFRGKMPGGEQFSGSGMSPPGMDFQNNKEFKNLGGNIMDAMKKSMNAMAATKT